MDFECAATRSCGRVSRRLGVGAALAIITRGLATAAFALHVSAVASYDCVYGWLGGAVAFLVWLYISNLALIARREVDAEFTRLWQFLADVDAETPVNLPTRDTTRELILVCCRAADETLGREIHESSGSGQH